MCRSHHRTLAIAILTAIAFQVTPIFAQGGDPEEGFREDLQETIEIYMVARLKRALVLSDAQERTVLPLIEQMNTDRRETNRRRRLLVMRLRPLVADNASADGEIAEVMDALEELDRTARASELKNREEIRAALSPRQQAQFVLFMESFRRDMADRIRGIEQPGGRKNAPSGAPPRR